MNLTQLPALAKRLIDSATLPANYIAAKYALSQCSKIDEVKEIADKHSAIAHYAKQIRDNSLKFYAERVYARALLRIADLLAELPTQKERREVAREYGVAGAKGLLEMARLPKQAREHLVERTPPAGRNELVREGYKLAPQRDNSRSCSEIEDPWKPYIESKDILEGMLGWLVEYDAQGKRTGRETAAQDLARKLSVEEAALLKPQLRKLIEWLDEFEHYLP